MSERLGELLLNYNKIEKVQLEEALKKQENSDKRLGQLLIELGYITEKDLVDVLEYQLGVPGIDINQYELNPSLASYIPENIARRYEAVPLLKENNKLIVAMADPTNIVAFDDMEMASGLKIEPVLTTKKEIRQAQGLVYTTSVEETAEVFASLTDYQNDEEPRLDELKQMVEEAPIVRLTNLIINQAVQMRASDIHIEPQESQIRVRYRIDGVLKKNMTVPKYSQAALISRLKIISDLDITKRRTPQDGRVRMNFSGFIVDMRVSTLPTIHGEKVVIRLLNKDESLLELANLGFSEENYYRFKKLIDKPHGIILATGPTGSGKSTTLFAILNYLNDPEKNIISIEDPVEYQLEGINQVQAQKRTDLTFARVLRSILRQDPDVIMIGEIRDEETAQIAVRAALTGHLVLSTLHTNDAVSSITRLIDMGIPPYLVASTVKGVIAQRLVRKLCTECKKEYKPGVEELEFIGEQSVGKLYKAGECNYCNSSGYRGRLAIQEILLVENEIASMIARNTGEQKIKKTAIEKGMKTMREDAREKLMAGLSSYEEMARVVI